MSKKVVADISDRSWMILRLAASRLNKSFRLYLREVLDKEAERQVGMLEKEGVPDVRKIIDTAISESR